MNPATDVTARSAPDVTDPAPAAQRRGRLGFYCYDWANSVFTTTVTSVFFGPYLTDVTRAAADAGGHVRPFGIPVLAESFFPYVVGLSVFLQIFVLPTAAVLTRRHGKGPLLAAASFTGATAAIAMYAIGDTGYLLGGALFMVATMALGGSITIYNTYLPQLAPPERQHRVSAYASAAGFVSSGIVLLVDLILYAGHDDFGLSEQDAIRIVLLTAGLWWLAFSALSLWLLRGHGRPAPIAGHDAAAGAHRVMFTAIRQLRAYPAAIWFLVAFLFYNNGTLIVTSMVGTYAVDELELSQDDVVIAVLSVQFAAVVGTAFLGRLAERFGGRTVLLALVVVWSANIVAGGLMPAGSFTGFMTLCVGAGLVVGSTYALSRSVFIRLIPAERVAEYIGIFEIVNRCLGFLGPVSFGLVLQLSGSYRVAWLSALVFLLLGALVLALGAGNRRKAVAR